MSRSPMQPSLSVFRPTGRMRTVLALLMILFTGLVLAVWFAPAIVARTSLVQRAVTDNTRDFAAQVSVGRVSLGWFSPVVVRDVVALDLQGQPLVTIAQVQTEKSLWGLLQDHRDLGGIYLDQPRAQVILRPDGTNIEDALRPWLEKPSEPSDLGCRVEIRDGLVEIVDQASGARWMADGTQVQVALPRDPQQPLAVRVQTTIRADQSAGAPCAVEILLQRAGGANAEPAGQVTFESAPLPLALAGTVAQRYVPGLQLGGQLAGKGRIQWIGAHLSLQTDGLHAEPFVLANTDWLGAEVLRLPRFDVRGELSQEGNIWAGRGLQLQSDIATLEFNGQMAMPAPSSPVASNWSQALVQSTCDLKAEADLARLAALLPGTLRVREGTRIASGRASVALSGVPQAEGNVWDAKVLVHSLAAEYQGRNIAWDQPVEVLATARALENAWDVKQLICRSSFLNLSATGSLTEGALQMEGDLARFAREVSQFVDLGQVQLAGRLTADARWQSAAQGDVTLSGNGVAQALEITVPGYRPLREQSLQLQVDARGKLAEGRLAELRQGVLQLVSAGDRLKLELTQPVLIGPDTAWPLKIHGEGQLASWLPRVQSFVPVSGWDLAGAATLDAVGRVAPPSVELNPLKLSVTDFTAKGAGVVLREPAISLETTALWDGVAGELRSEALTFASAMLAVRASDVRVRTAGDERFLSGDATYRAQLERLLALIPSGQSGPPTYRIAGEAVGRIQLASTGSVTTAKSTAEVTNFQYATLDSPAGTQANQPAAWQTVWNEPKLNLAADGRYDSQQNAVELSQIQVAGQALSAAAVGRVQDLTGRCQLDLAGKLAYDLQQVVPRLSPKLAAQLQLSGRDTRDFKFQGPLFAVASPAPAGVRQVSTSSSTTPSGWAFEEMKAEASLAWQSADVAGFKLGPATIDTRLADGILSFSPLQVPVSEGQLHLQPLVDLKRSPAMLTQGAGPLIQQVRLSPDLCRGWLKYVAPLIADATAAEGQFSVNLAGAALPLADPLAGNVQGTLQVHAARVGPGPLSQQFLSIAEQVKAIVDRRPLPTTASNINQWLELPAQEVSFQMVDGRVHHRGLQMVVGDVAVRTQGSVGFDESLYLVAEVPIRDEWVAKDRYLSALRGQVIQLPVQGSFTRPRVDNQALTNLARQTITSAGQQMLQQEISRGLDRFLRPPAQQPPAQP